MYRRLAAVILSGVIASGLLIGGNFQSANAAAKCRVNVYAYGGSGECVKALQVMLSGSSSVSPSRPDIGAPIARDGKFGSKTRQAVQKYQRANKLVVDGRVGPKTWAKLCGSGFYWGDNKVLKAQYRWAKPKAC